MYAPRQSRKNISLVLLGIVLPLVTLSVELSTRMCSEFFFDPIPSLGHILWVFLVPVINFWVWLAILNGEIRQPKLLGFVNGMSIGIAFFYTLLFLPILPISFILIVVYGFGLLPLSPLLALISGMFFRRQLRKMLSKDQPMKVPGLWLGILVALLLPTAMELPKNITRLGLKMAASPVQATHLRGLTWLRAVGREDVMLLACYRRPQMTCDLFSFFFTISDPVSPDEARGIFYAVTGVPFNKVPYKELKENNRWLFWGDRDFDFDQGGTVVGGRVEGLSLASSRLDGSLDADAALGYVEWTMVFRNSHEFGQSEARAQLALPPNGVVSRLTLWVNGEEREAAFASRGKVREAYQKVVSQRRDPVLVTSCGPDRVLMQCFPVPPNGGEMKVRLGISFPLHLENKEQGLARMPYILERNFDINQEFQHGVWIESKQPLQSLNQTLKIEHPEPDLYGVRGSVTDLQLVEATTIQASRSSRIGTAWTKDPVSQNGELIKQTLEEKKVEPPSRIVLVIDASGSMKTSLPEVVASFSKLPGGVEVSGLVASDTLVELSQGVQKGSAATYAALAEQLKRVECVGGRDNLPALCQAWDVAAESPRSVIVWVHGPQPLTIGRIEELQQRWERRPNNPVLYEFQVSPGPNRILEKLDGVKAVKTIPRFAGAGRELERLFSTWNGTSQQLVAHREKIKGDQTQTSEDSKETSAHLARLWAHEKISELIATQNTKATKEAVELAAAYHLVTPVSGAVVLETQQQFKDAGLEPAESGKVPTVPEPGTWVLIGVIGMVLTLTLLRKNLTRQMV